MGGGLHFQGDHQVTLTKPKRKSRTMKFLKNIGTRSALVAAAAATAATSASAAIDTAGVTSALAEAGTAAGVVGAAVLVVYVGIKAFKLIKGAL
jgi:hypothetical protein